MNLLANLRQFQNMTAFSNNNNNNSNNNDNDNNESESDDNNNNQHRIGTQYASTRGELFDCDKLKMLIDGYSKQQVRRYYISADIIQLIYNFYDINKTAFLLMIKCHSQTSKIIEFIDIYTNKRYQGNMLFASYDNRFSEVYASDNNNCNKYIEQKCKLPRPMMEDCKSKFIFEYISNATFSSNEWSLIFKFGEKVSHITAFHPKVCFENNDDDDTKKKNASKHFEKMSFVGYNLNIPNIPNCSNKNSSVIFNKTNENLYAFNNDTIYSLDFMRKDIYDKQEWQIWKNKSIINNKYGSICMVDKDRFVALINANNKKSYLISMNSTKLCIPLADSCKNRKNGVSMYHDIYHKIITIGDYTAEWYDINKDKSIIFANFKWCDAENVWYSPFNPNILYGTTTKITKNSYHQVLNVGLFSIDLREGTSKYHDIVKSNEDCSKWWNAIYLRL